MIFRHHLFFPILPETNTYIFSNVIGNQILHMAFYKFDSLQFLDDSEEEWIIRVRAQSIWKGINRQTGEVKGYNIIFCNDYVSTTTTLALFYTVIYWNEIEVINLVNSDAQRL